MPQGDNGPKRDWPAIRREYEKGSIGYRALAERLNIPESTLNQRRMREKWVRNAVLVKKTSEEIDARLQIKVKEEIAKELAPWIEAEKVKFTKRGVRLAKSGLKRVESFFKVNESVDAKADAMIAKAGESWHRVGRVALGMNDGSAVVTPLTLNLLGNHQAIQINSPNEPESNT